MQPGLGAGVYCSLGWVSAWNAAWAGCQRVPAAEGRPMAFPLGRCAGRCQPRLGVSVCWQLKTGPRAFLLNPCARAGGRGMQPGLGVSVCWQLGVCMHGLAVDPCSQFPLNWCAGSGGRGMQPRLISSMC